jgi:hypothetical protein
MGSDFKFEWEYERERELMALVQVDSDLKDKKVFIENLLRDSDSDPVVKYEIIMDLIRKSKERQETHQAA